ncbi:MULTISPECIES: hypothetical protein [unclassified Paenibacillus]|uniref:hypothetical protein n=1 Tax=unclassified Paenibacillus TaxID=185978 RepID=UPI003F7F0048
MFELLLYKGIPNRFSVELKKDYELRRRKKIFSGSARLHHLRLIRLPEPIRLRPMPQENRTFFVVRLSRDLGEAMP